MPVEMPEEHALSIPRAMKVALSVSLQSLSFPISFHIYFSFQAWFFVKSFELYIANAIDESCMFPKIIWTLILTPQEVVEKIYDTVILGDTR